MPVNRFDESAADPADTADEPKGPEAFHRLERQLEELGEYGRLYLSARADAIVARLRQIGLWAVAAVGGVAILCALLATATVIGVLGLAQLIGQALGERLWAGYLITGFGMLALFVAAIVAAAVILPRRFRSKTVKKYERRHQTQRARFGRDVAGRS